MIKVPLEALGFRFESEDIPLLILSFTNYYPCLIQLFCRQLLSRIYEEDQFINTRSGPPYIIQRKHIRRLYTQTVDLRKAIVDRFRWTLNLDRRYEFITLYIVDKSIKSEDSDDLVMHREFSASDLFEESLRLWPAGFNDDDSLDGFKTILEEMCGLVF